jgi:hypothetical protein
VRSQRQLALLIVQFLLGMAVNVIGAPSEHAAAAAETAYYVLVSAHVLVALGLVGGAIVTIVWAVRQGSTFRGLAWLGGVSVAIAFVAGVSTGALTMTAAPISVLGDVTSYLMAAAFLAALISYGVLYERTNHPQHDVD